MMFQLSLGPSRLNRAWTVFIDKFRTSIKRNLNINFLINAGDSI